MATTTAIARTGTNPAPVMTNSSILKPEARLRPYKDFLTPALHRRFTNAALVVLAGCWFEATLMSEFHIFWSWFPFGLTGIRTLLLFIPSLCVFIVRVANLHVGSRTTTSPLETLYQHATSFKTLQTFGWYLFSSWFFGVVYIWSTAAAANLSIVDQGRPYERPRLNENPIFLRTLFFCAGIAQSCLHLYRDYDQVRIPVSKGTTQKSARTSSAPQETEAQSNIPKSLLDMRALATLVLQRAVSLTVFTVTFGLPLYFIILRRLAWKISYVLTRPYFSKLPKDASPSGLLEPMTLLMRTAGSTVLLVLLWELSNQAFSTFLSEEPIRKGLPLTSEHPKAGNALQAAPFPQPTAAWQNASGQQQKPPAAAKKDPNGSLIAGLKSKKEVPRAFAFWELAVICETFEERRKTIYAEYERRGGSTWSQMSRICLDELLAIENRLKEADRPLPTAAELREKEVREQLKLDAQKSSLPKIADQKIQDADIWSKRQQANGALPAASDMAKSYGQSPGAKNPALQYANKAIQYTSNKALTREQQQQFSVSALGKQANGYFLQLARSPLGLPFRQTFARRLRAAVFGVPHSNAVNIVHAARSLSKLAVHSLREDSYGQVSRDVPLVLRTLTSTINAVENFARTLPVHWTDVEFKESDRKVREVEQVMGVLRLGLEEMLLAFGEYTGTLGLTKTEVRLAKEAAAGRGGGLEMEQRR